MEISKTLAEQNGNQSSAMLGELTGDELFVQNGNQAGSAMGELTGDELLAQNGNQAGVGVAEHFDEFGKQHEVLTFTAGTGGASVGFYIANAGYELPEDYKRPSLQYSTDGGVTWEDYYLMDTDTAEDVVPIELAEGASIMFRGVNENLAYYLEDTEDLLYVQAFFSGNIAASGDVTSLLNGIGGDVAIPQYCYSGMFGDCTSLNEAPALPATTLSEGCYEGMFSGCTSLSEAPALPATTLAKNCYFYMFQGCSGLTQAPALPATTLAKNCYSGMFQGCSGLEQAPALPATTLSEDCYKGMFRGCSSITSHDVVTLNDSENVFANNLSCISFTIHADTPPEIADSTIRGLKDDCDIYVPAASVDAYKAAQYWSARANYIQAIA